MVDEHKVSDIRQVDCPIGVSRSTHLPSGGPVVLIDVAAPGGHVTLCLLRESAESLVSQIQGVLAEQEGV